MRHYIFLLTLSLLTILSQVSQAQITFKYGPELGLVFSQFPKKVSYIVESRNDKVTETTNPPFSPLIGLTTDLTIKKYLNFSLGLQYQKIGDRYHYHRDGNDLLYGGTYTDDTWENQTYHKICIPITAGICVKIGKFKPSIFVGYRPNYFLSGKNHVKDVFDHSDPAHDATSEHEFHPQLINTYIGWSSYNPSRQFFCGVSTTVGQNLKISLTVNRGEYLFFPWESGACTGYGFTNNDYIISVAYLFPTG